MRVHQAIVAFTGFLIVVSPRLSLASAIPTADTEGRTTTYGVNDWGCRAADGRDPVVFLHGLGAPAFLNWLTKAPLVAAEGYCVFTPQYGSKGGVLLGFKSMRSSSQEVTVYIDRVRASTGAAKVNIIGHSMGTATGAWYIKHGGAAKVRSFVGLGAVYHGTTVPALGIMSAALPGQISLIAALCDSCVEFSPSSSFSAELAAGGVTVPGVDYTTIVSRLDSTVVPYTSGLLDEPGVTNIVLQEKCPADMAGHNMQAIDPNVTNLIIWALKGKVGPMPACLPFLIPG